MRLRDHRDLLLVPRPRFGQRVLLPDSGRMPFPSAPLDSTPFSGMVLTAPGSAMPLIDTARPTGWCGCDRALSRLEALQQILLDTLSNLRFPMERQPRSVGSIRHGGQLNGR